MNEEWKKIVGFENIYQVSNQGRIRNLRNNKILSQKKTKTGYCRVRLSIDGIKTDYLVHRLVASAFIENSENKKTVNHINEIKSDNYIQNLEWATQAEQNIHGTRIARVIASTDYKGKSIDYNVVAAKHDYYQINKKQMKPILQLDEYGFFIARHEGVAVAARAIGVCAGHISSCLKGRRGFCGGYKWKYA